ncbi:MAG: hypothetical protein AB1416_01675 [Actinomycetota bacterium]
MSVAVVALVAWPLLRREEALPAPAPAADERRQVQEELDRTLAAINEMEFDRRAGNLSEEDHARLDAEERARAVELIRRRDELGEG